MTHGASGREFPQSSSYTHRYLCATECMCVRASVWRTRESVRARACVCECVYAALGSKSSASANAAPSSSFRLVNGSGKHAFSHFYLKSRAVFVCVCVSRPPRVCVACFTAVPAPRRVCVCVHEQNILYIHQIFIYRNINRIINLVTRIRVKIQNKKVRYKQT